MSTFPPLPGDDQPQAPGSGEPAAAPAAPEAPSAPQAPAFPAASVPEPPQAPQAPQPPVPPVPPVGQQPAAPQFPQQPPAAAPQAPQYPQQPNAYPQAPQQPQYQQPYPAAGGHQPPPVGGYQQPYQAAPANSGSTVTLNYWLSVFFTWVPALIFFLVERGKNPLADEHHRANLNFSLLRVFVSIGGWILSFIPFLGGFLFFLAWAALFVLHIIAAIKGPEAFRNGQTYRFPLNISLIK